MSSVFELALSVPGRAGLLAAAASLTSVLVLWSLKGNRQLVKNVAKVKNLTIYPIKSVGGVKVGTLEVTPNGVKYGLFRDRAMMLVNDEDRLFTQRQDARLALVKISFEDFGTLRLSFHGKNDLLVRPKNGLESGDQVHEVTLWGSNAQGVEVHPDASRWFSEIVEQEVKLIQHLEPLLKRPAKYESKKGLIHDRKSEILFHDDDPVHLTAEATLVELNQTIGEVKRMSHDNFRSNIVISGCESRIEETFDTIIINGTRYKRTKLCERCIVPTVDRDEGVRIPARTDVMKKFRPTKDDYEKLNYKSSPVFGIQLAPTGHGVISIGDTIAAVFK